MRSKPWRTRRARDSSSRRLIVLDTSYTWDDASRRSAENVFFYRDLGGYFEEVWSVHPFVGNPSSRLGRPRLRRVHTRHVIIEGGAPLPDSFSVEKVARFALGQIRLALLLARLGLRQRISAIRAGDPLYLGVLGLALSRVVGCPLVIRVSGNFDEIRAITNVPMMPRLFQSVAQEKRVEGFVLRRADWVFAPNENNLGFALRRGARRGRSSVVRYGSVIGPEIWGAVAARETPPRGDCPSGNWRPFVLVVSRLEPVKQVAHALRAFALAAKFHPEIELWIAGDGSQRSALEVLARELGIDGRVRFWGNMDQGWLARAYSSCRVLLSPQAGRALSEAALMGAPIVAYDRDWQSEMVNSQEVGRLVPAGDWNALGATLEWALSHEDAANEMGNNLRNRALDLLSPESALKDEVSIYEGLATSRSVG